MEGIFIDTIPEVGGKWRPATCILQLLKPVGDMEEEPGRLLK
jgi:hypothetical protein